MIPLTDRILIVLRDKGQMGRADIVSHFPEHSVAVVNRAIGRLQAGKRVQTVVSKGWGRKAIYAAALPVVIREWPDPLPVRHDNPLHQAMLAMIATKNHVHRQSD